MNWLQALQFVLLATVLFAARKGDEPERLVAIVLFCAFVLDLVNHALFGDPAWYSINPGHIVLDTWAFASLLWVAVHANRGWTLWVSGAQVLVLLGHIGKTLDVTMARRAYWAMTQMPLVFQIVFLAIGTLAHIYRRQRIGHYHSWRLT